MAGGIITGTDATFAAIEPTSEMTGVTSARTRRKSTTTAGSCAAIYGMATIGQPRAKGKSCGKDIAILDVTARTCGVTARTSAATGVTCTGTDGEKIESSGRREIGSESNGKTF